MSNLAVYLLNAEECYILNQRILSILKADLSKEISYLLQIPGITGIKQSAYEGNILHSDIFLRGIRGHLSAFSN
jgi:hypothetical protein